MSMDGKRFGFGLAVGAMLAAGVVVVSGLLATTPMSFGPTLPSAQSATVTAETTVTYSSTTSTPTASVTYGMSNGTTAATNTVSGAQQALFNLQGIQSALAPLPSSRLAAVAAQDPASNVLLILPVLLALGLGGILYRASTRRRGTSGTEDE